MPHTQPWFLGVANLRGGLHGVVDLAAFLGLRAPQALDALREQARLLALNAGAGLRSARCSSTAWPGCAAPNSCSPSRPTASRAPPLPLRRWRDADGRVWQEIDLAALARSEPFLAIAA